MDHILPVNLGIDSTAWLPLAPYFCRLANKPKSLSSKSVGSHPLRFSHQLLLSFRLRTTAFTISSSLSFEGLSLVAVWLLRLRVSARCCSSPGLYTTVTSYCYSLIRMFCRRFGASFRGLVFQYTAVCLLNMYW